MSETELNRIRRRFSDAYRTRDFAECTRLAAEGVRLAEATHDVKTQTLMLVWQGETHWQRKETEQAVSALTRAASAKPPANPSDVLNAISTLLNIAILERPLDDIRARLEQGRAHLERHDQLRSRHMLDLSEGDLAARRGDWRAALAHYRDAHQHQSIDTGEPRFTVASYLIKLAEASFMLGDAQALSHWCSEIDAAPKLVDSDRLRAEQARLLCYRAGLPEPAGTRGGGATSARRVLRWLEEFDAHQADFARDAMQVLLREGDWLSVETWLQYPGIGEVPLLRGDLHLARARAALGLPPQDPDWPLDKAEFPHSTARVGTQATPNNKADLAKADDALKAASAHYAAEAAWVAREDERLQTEHLSSRLRARDQQISALSQQLSETHQPT